MVSFEEWTTLQSFLKTKLFDKGLNDFEIWLSVQDGDVEGVWKDFFTGKTIENYTIPWMGSKPDGGSAQNCARLDGVNSWGDRECDFDKHTCMCSPSPGTYLTLRGLCSSSSIDFYFKPMNDLADIRKVKLQGLTHSSLTYDEEKNVWTLDVANSNVTAISRAPHFSFTLGKFNCTIEKDKGCMQCRRGVCHRIEDVWMSGR